MTSLGAWLDPKVVARLSAVNIATVAQLVEFANEHGHRWHRLVPKLGEKTAAKLIKWLADDTANGQVVGLSDYARTPRTLIARQPGTAPSDGASQMSMAVMVEQHPSAALTASTGPPLNKIKASCEMTKRRSKPGSA